MTSNELRAKFLQFFATKDHTVVPSSSLVPAGDATLLFTNAGMVQFKDVFTGQDSRPYKRAASSQKCVRAGGKHNDLENVGYTARHHTFFEMLGNFSFGDYFKQDAIAWAWEFITSPAWLGIDKSRLLVTIYHTDDEAFDIWHTKMGVAADRIVRIGDNKGAPYASDNFWAMGDTGPCGPCSEIFYDHDPDGSKGIYGGPPGSPEEDGDRWIEIWNVVFMQFERTGKGEMLKLPAPSVDTGMGLERISALMQGSNDNYQTDTFKALIAAVAKLAGLKPYENPSQKVVADHIRAASFLIADGITPSNEGRGYVLRRIMRRAIRHGYKLGLSEAFFYKLVAPLAAEMGEAFPQIRAQQAAIEKIIRQEEDSFAVTLNAGMGLLEKEVQLTAAVSEMFKAAFPQAKISKEVAVTDAAGKRQIIDLVVDDQGRRTAVEVVRNVNFDAAAIEHALLKLAAVKDSFDKSQVVVRSDNADEEVLKKYGAVEERVGAKVDSFFLLNSDLDKYRVISGEAAFKLYDTYGFPLDLTEDFAREVGYSVDKQGFEAQMQAQRTRARAASQFKSGEALRYEGVATQFVGYEALSIEGAKVLALYRDGAPVQSLAAGDAGVVVLDKTPFYAEGGGQIGDAGHLGAFKVADTQKITGAAFGHSGSLESGMLKVGDTVTATVESSMRRATIRNHSATHLLHAALRQVLGTHVSQKGSLVNTERTRFDFSHGQAVTADEIAEIERLVNAEVLANHEVGARLMSFDDAVASGAMALFGEKYGAEVRVLKMGSFSTELCGGTHVTRTGDIGLFKVVSEGGVAAGVRRIEAVTGENALGFVSELQSKLNTAATVLKTSPADLGSKISGLLEANKALEKELAALKSKLAAGQGDELLAKAATIKGVKVLAAQVETDANGLRTLHDQLKQKLGSGILLLGAASDGKASLIAGVTADLIGKVKAGELVNFVAGQVGGKGGGRPDMAQAGGTQPEHLPAAIASVVAWVEAKL